MDMDGLKECELHSTEELIMLQHVLYLPHTCPISAPNLPYI